MNAPPVQALQQGAKLGGGEPDRAVLDLGPTELALFEPLGVEA